MLDALLKNKFYRKCKKAIRLTKVQIEIISRRRNAMQKYLKKDVADLLKNGLDKNAYDRAESLIVELNLTSCYDLTNNLCDQILKILSVISNQRECPEVCQEAVASLIFAAARLARLPELRHLRSIFTERYGNAIDCYANKEFVEKLKLAHPTKDVTLQLMQDIATETGLHWDSKATEENLYNPPPATEQVRSNVADNFLTSEKPEDGKLCSNTTHVSEGSYNSIPPTESRIRDVSISDAESTTSNPKKYNLECEKKMTELTVLDENQPDEEERWLDRLLMHFSRKTNKPSNKGKNTDSAKIPPPEQDFNSKTTRNCTRSRDFRATRAALSFNAETKIESRETNTRGYIRSTSFQPEMLRGCHVHPKLPDDYDHFLAQLAAIRGEGNQVAAH